MDQQASLVLRRLDALGVSSVADELDGTAPRTDVHAVAYLPRRVDPCDVGSRVDAAGARELLTELLAPLCEELVWYGGEGMGDALRALGRSES